MSRIVTHVKVRDNFPFRSSTHPNLPKNQPDPFSPMVPPTSTNLTATYTSPSPSTSTSTTTSTSPSHPLSKTFTHPLPSPHTTSLASKTFYLSTLRQSLTSLQDNVNLFLTQKMDEDKLLLAAKAGLKVDEKKKKDEQEEEEEDNYGEEGDGEG
ncbi:MAG: hypothetical protein Q9202_005508 [Teloschistes flavicans]